MFAEIVPEQLRSVVYAFDRSFEGAIAACAAPLVGALLKLLAPVILARFLLELLACTVLTAMHKFCRRI